jgi:hypothetical protein
VIRDDCLVMVSVVTLEGPGLYCTRRLEISASQTNFKIRSVFGEIKHRPT